VTDEQHRFVEAVGARPEQMVLSDKRSNVERYFGR